MALFRLDSSDLHFTRSFRTNNTKPSRTITLYNYSQQWLSYKIGVEKDVFDFGVNPRKGVLGPSTGPNAKRDISVTKHLRAQSHVEDRPEETFQLEAVLLDEDEVDEAERSLKTLWDRILVEEPERFHRVTFQARFSRDYYEGDCIVSASDASQDVTFIVARTLGRGEYYLNRKQRPAGRGGFGTVYHTMLRLRRPEEDGHESSPTSWQEICGAVKIIRARNEGDDADEVNRRALRRLYKEIDAWLFLEHVNIAPLLGWHAYPEPGLITPWYENGTARAYLERVGRARNYMRIVLGLAAAVKYLHNERDIFPIIHGDIKGDNILIDNDGCAKLTDFGLCRLREEAVHQTSTTSLQYTGNTRFTSPEIFEGKRRTSKSDIYAFAATVLELATGKLPFCFRRYAPHVNELLASHPSPGGTRVPYEPELSRSNGLWKVMEPCWEAIPEKRPGIQMVLTILGLFAKPEDSRPCTSVPE